MEVREGTSPEKVWKGKREGISRQEYKGRGERNSDGGVGRREERKGDDRRENVKKEKYDIDRM